MTDPTSRYARTPIAQFALPDGRRVACLSPRLSPLGQSLTPAAVIDALPLDRIDRLAARALADPRQFWRLCDANNAIDPITFGQGPGRVIVPEPAPGE